MLVRFWPLVRALLVGIVLLYQVLDTIPLPDVTRRDLRRPIARAEITRWTGVAQSFGLAVAEEDTTEFALLLGGGAGRFRKTVLRPAWPFKRITGTGQAWGLFAYPDPFAGRLVISGRPEQGEWRELYRAPSEGESWLVDLVQYRRIRGIYDDNGDRPRPGGMHKALTRWLSREIFTRHPSLDEVEIRLDLVEVRLPGEGEEPLEAPRHARVERRDERMP